MDTIRRQCIGVSAHQKLELLTSLVKLCNYDSVAVFGDCFDEARQLPPLLLFKWPRSAGCITVSTTFITSSCIRCCCIAPASV